MHRLKRAVVLLMILSVAHHAEVVGEMPVGTAFTYQAQLKEAGVPLNGNVDLRFELFDAEINGNPIGSPLLLEDVPVVKGLFSVELDFGAAAFTGHARWMQIEVQVPQDGGGTLVVPLSPRQPLTGAPYALFSLAPWQQNGNDVSYTAGNVGIGTTAPQKALHLDLPSNAREGILLAKAGTSLGTQLAVSGSNNQQFSIDIDPNNVSSFEQFEVTYNGGPPVLMIDSEGDVGIGTNTPAAELDVAGTIRATEAIVDGFVTITRPDISGTVALRLDIGRLWVVRQFGSGASGQLELASLKRSDGSISNKDFIINTTGDVVTGGDVVIGGHIDIGYEIVTVTADDDACSLCCNLGEDLIARCPSGKRVLGGGCTQPGEGLSRGCDPLLESYPTEAGDGWVCDVDAGIVGAAHIKAWAICANVK